MSDDGLFREVDEEVRRDKATQIWNKFGNLIVAGCVLIVLGVGGYKGWQYWQFKVAEKAGMEWYNAIALTAANKSEEAEAVFDKITQSDHKGYATLAKLLKAARLGQDKKVAEAVAVYDEVAAEEQTDKPLRELARVRAAYLLVDSASVDELTKRLAGLDGANSSWRHAVREILALTHFRTGDYKKADEQINLILADEATPAAMRTRADLVSSHLRPLLSASGS